MVQIICGTNLDSNFKMVFNKQKGVTLRWIDKHISGHIATKHSLCISYTRKIFHDTAGAPDQNHTKKKNI